MQNRFHIDCTNGFSKSAAEKPLKLAPYGFARILDQHIVFGRIFAWCVKERKKAYGKEHNKENSAHKTTDNCKCERLLMPSLFVVVHFIN